MNNDSSDNAPISSHMKVYLRVVPDCACFARLVLRDFLLSLKGHPFKEYEMNKLPLPAAVTDHSSLVVDSGLYPLHMSQQQVTTEYIKVQKHSENRTLMVTIPFAFVEAIKLQKGDTVKMMLLKNKTITLERV